MAFEGVEEEVSHRYEGHREAHLDEELDQIGERCDDHPDYQLDEPETGLD